MKVREILKKKGIEVYTIGENKKLVEAIDILVRNNIGSLLVLKEDGNIVGIITERDVLRESNKSLDEFRESVVKNVMSKNLIVVEPDDDMEYVESIMTQNRIRHLPILQNKVLVGIISIGDVVKNMLSEARYDNKYMRDYIGGNVA